MIASTSKEPFQGFSPPAWIFSLDDSPLPDPPPAPGPSSRLNAYAPSPATRSRLDPDWEDEDASYGPTLKRRGNVHFVRSKLGGGIGAHGAHSGDKGKGRELNPSASVPKGEMVRGLYESIVAVGVELATPRPPAPAPPRRPPDVDLTLDSDSDSDDDIIIIDPTTSLPCPKPLPPPPRIRRRRRQPIPAIHELLQYPSAAPVVPQVSYGLNPNNIGFQMLLKQGWKQGEGLGVVGEDGGGTTALKEQDPLKMKREREEERRAKDDEEVSTLGALGLAEKAKRDERERKELLAYLNRP